MYLGKYQEAIHCFNRILFLNPTAKHVLMNKYEALTKLGKIKDAEKCYNMARKIKDNKQRHDSITSTTSPVREHLKTTRL
jgi:tetratricopeptide (TPR) repeat protein